MRVAHRHGADLDRSTVHLQRVAVVARFGIERDLLRLQMGHTHVDPHQSVILQGQQDIARRCTNRNLAAPGHALDRKSVV